MSRAVSASAGLVAVCALAVSAYQTKIMRDQQKMSAWPYVTQGNTGGDPSYGYVVQNAGVGPAIVRSMTVTVDGRPLHRWADVVEIALRIDSTQIDTALAGSKWTTSSIQRGLVLLPGSTTHLVQLGGPHARAIRRFLNDKQTLIRVCYCSLYEDCWVSDNQQNEPTPTRDCPDDPKLEFAS